MHQPTVHGGSAKDIEDAVARSEALQRGYLPTHPLHLREDQSAFNLSTTQYTAAGQPQTKQHRDRMTAALRSKLEPK